MYGRLDKGKCPGVNHRATDKCIAASSLTATKFLCDGKASCTLSASNGVYGDPCVSVYKYLEVRYKCAW